MLLSAALIPAALGAMAADAPADNAELVALHDASQSERQALFATPHTTADARRIAEERVWERDLTRRDAALRIVRGRGLTTAADHWRAAFVLQHSPDIDDIRLAFSLATIAATLDPDVRQYRWLAAAAWDRILASRGQPQWYGTQFQADPDSGLQTQTPIAPGAVTDEERIASGVPTLEESRRMLESINAGAR